MHVARFLSSQVLLTSNKTVELPTALIQELANELEPTALPVQCSPCLTRRLGKHELPIARDQSWKSHSKDNSLGCRHRGCVVFANWTRAAAAEASALAQRLRNLCSQQAASWVQHVDEDLVSSLHATFTVQRGHVFPWCSLSLHMQTSNGATWRSAQSDGSCMLRLSLNSPYWTGKDIRSLLVAAAFVYRPVCGANKLCSLYCVCCDLSKCL